jgi:hypothetical protein
MEKKEKKRKKANNITTKHLATPTSTPRCRKDSIAIHTNHIHYPYPDYTFYDLYENKQNQPRVWIRHGTIDMIT